MTVQIAVKLDDRLAERVKAAAEDAGTNLSEWVRAALQRQARVAKAMRARAEEDARGRVYTDEREDALVAARRRRVIAAFDDRRVIAVEVDARAICEGCTASRSSTPARRCSTAWCG